MQTKDGKVEAATNESLEVERLRAEVDKEHEMYLRALADFDNYRRRVERERSSASRSGKRDIILSLLEVLDSFDRAFQHAKAAPGPMLEGMQAIHRKLLALIEAQGVTPFSSVGDAFNPEFHEAIGSVETD